MSKPKIAFFEFTSCEGCQLTVIDSLHTMDAVVSSLNCEL